MSSPIIESILRPMPYPDPRRTAAIDKWERIFDQAIAELELVRSFLIEARAKAPTDVDAIRLYDQIESIRKAVNALLEQMEMVEFEDLFTAITGQYCWHIYAERELNDANCDFAFWQDEITAIDKYHPADAAKLQAILNTRHGGVL